MSIRPFAGYRPILDALRVAAELRGASAEGSIIGSHNLRTAQALNLDEKLGDLGGVLKGPEKLVETSRAPAEICEFMDSGRRLKILRQSDRWSACVSSGHKRSGLFRDLNMIPRFPPAELAVLRRSSFFPAGRTFRMYLSHLGEGRPLNDCDAVSWHSDRGMAAARGSSHSRDCSFDARPTVSKYQVHRVVRTSSLPGDFALLATVS